MGKTYRIVIPGAAFLDEMEAMRVRLASFLNAKDDIPFQLFFDHFELTAENKSLKNKLLRRGSFGWTGAQYKNNGSAISHTLKNIGPTLDQAELYVPRAIHVAHNLAGSDLKFEFLADRPLIELSRVPLELGIGRRFLFASLSWDKSGALYSFVQEDDPSNVLELLVDVSQSQIKFLADGALLGLRSRLRLAMAHTFAGGGCCSGFEVIEDLAPPGPLCFVLHAKVLAPPVISIEDQIAAVNATFAVADVSVTLGSVEYLNLPDLVELDVGGCQSGEVTDEQIALFRHRNFAAARDVCAYWVQTLQGTGNWLGCASHPAGVWALAAEASGGTPYLLAHELGHVLGINHVREDCLAYAPELMNSCDSYSSPPPDLSAWEVETLRNVAWRHGILQKC